MKCCDTNSNFHGARGQAHLLEIVAAVRMANVVGEENGALVIVSGNRDSGGASCWDGGGGNRVVRVGVELVAIGVVVVVVIVVPRIVIGTIIVIWQKHVSGCPRGRLAVLILLRGVVVR